MVSTSQPQQTVLLDYCHPDGPNVTHVRGLLLSNAIDNLKRWKVYDAYLETVPRENRTWLVSTLATSWVEVGAAISHYKTTSELRIPDGSLEEAGRLMANRVAGTYLSGRKLGGGAEEFAVILSHNDRMWERMYKGGGCRVLRPQANELILEDYGNPLFAFHAYRHAYNAYIEAIATLYCPKVQVSSAPAPRRHGVNGVATRLVCQDQ